MDRCGWRDHRAERLGREGGLPLTTTAASEDDRRGWYLSLRRSYENLQQLRAKIEDDLIPAMIREAEELAATDFTPFSNAELAAEVRRRADRSQHWSNVYWADFIPYAHGARLFGQIYNDTIKPENPYEFADLLTDTPMASLKRNRHLEELAADVREASGVADDLRRGRMGNLPASFRASLDRFVAQYGTLSSGIAGDSEGALAESTLVRLILELAARPGQSSARKSVDHEALVRRFIDAFAPEERDWAQSLLDLARSSYRLRDDDNIHLGRIEAQASRAVREAAARLANASTTEDAKALREALSLMPPDKAAPVVFADTAAHGPGLQARQLVGQPAGPGLAKGPARVVATPQDLKAFQSGEILICDAVGPNASGRGSAEAQRDSGDQTVAHAYRQAVGLQGATDLGSSVSHGAVIAREYGLPCVTGVPEVMQFIRSGDQVTVDGYLGIVIISPANT